MDKTTAAIVPSKANQYGTFITLHWGPSAEFFADQNRRLLGTMITVIGRKSWDIPVFDRRTHERY